MYTLIKGSDVNEYLDVDDLMDALYYNIISTELSEITERDCSISFNYCAGKVIHVTGLTRLEVRYLSSKYS